MRPALLRAYRNTCYTTCGIDVRIGQRSPAMDRLLLSHGAREAAFLTAYNPFSRPMPVGWNQRMQAQLVQTLRRHQVLHAVGSWRRWSEAHIVVLGDARSARKLARRFRQNAIVIVRLGQPAWLLVGSSMVEPNRIRWVGSTKVRL
jgi:uncharacterized protein DUF3293